MNARLKIAVLLGGPSAEREVSLRSGAAVAAALRSLGHEVFEVDPVPGQLRLPAGVDAVFIALHGTYGEDGVVQSELDKLGVPYTGCDSSSSKLAFDKVETKAMLLKHRIPTPRSRVFARADAPWPSDWHPPVVLKPVRQGSSVGLRFVDRVEDFPEALAFALKHDTEVLMEEKIVGKESTVGILDGKALPIVEIRPAQGVYDYHHKYTSGATTYICPGEFDASTTQRVQQAATAAFAAVGGRDYGRIDVMVKADGTPMVLEVNTLPGMTETSLMPKAAAAAGLNFPNLCQAMIDLAVKRGPRT
ncbi:MAG TPA: D-alanine--D-alanine ligase [Candidatus Limnocylindria bacterium]|jgi:D-alanine-D-alanine ligase|nr:D-alanine--D-alanine ligase [Candidatus Limnocylindria bacterium]